MRDLLAELTRSVTRENEQLQLALKYLVNCRHRDARTACLSVVEQNPQLALGQLVLGYILMQEGDFSAAIGKLRTALALDAGLGLAHLCIGVIMLELMKLDEAISEARAAVNTDADNGVYQAFLGELYFQAGLDGPAAEALQNALRSNPYDVASHYKLANIYLREGQDSDALRETATALRSSPSYNSYLTLGNLRLAQQRYPEALEEYVRAMRINPVGPEVHMRVGQVCAMLGDYEVALLEIRTALKARPRHALSLYLLGGVYRKLARFADALKAYQSALKLDQNLPNIHAELGESCLQLAGPDGADMALWEQAAGYFRGAAEKANVRSEQGERYFKLAQYREAAMEFRDCLVQQTAWSPGETGRLTEDGADAPSAAVARERGSRYSYRFPLKIRGDSRSVDEVMAINVSGSGLLLETESDMQPGTEVELLLQFTFTQQPVSLKGRVARSEQIASGRESARKKYRLGIELVLDGGEDDNEWRGLLDI